MVEVEPAAGFVVDCPAALAETHPLFVREAVFGVLDVVIAAQPHPLKDFLLRVVEMEVHPVDSSQHAFRRAGHDAGRKILAELGLRCCGSPEQQAGR